MTTISTQGWSSWQGTLVALLAGMALPLAFAPFYLYPLAVLSLSLLFLSWNNVSTKCAAWRGFCFGLGFFGVGVSWVFVAIHDFGYASIWLAALLTTLFVAFLASYLAVLGWLTKKVSTKTFSLSDYLLFLPLLWLLFEVFKAWFLTGFPWLELGVSQIEGPLRGYLPIIGAGGVSLLVAISAGLLAASWQRRRVSLLIAFAAIWLAGSFLSQQEWTHDSGSSIDVSLIQGNVPQDVKWDQEQITTTLTLYQTLTEQNWQSDLIIWPENAVTVFYHQAKQFFLDPLAELARQNDSDILLGLPILDRETQQYYNGMVSLGEHQAVYKKRHLVPFGEYVPFEWLRGLIGFFDLPMSSFSAGQKQQPLLQAAGQQVGVSVCYEDTFSYEVLNSLPEATILVNASNNAWYGDSFAPHQHLQISQARALETGRPVLRATTNGISALIDYKGQIVTKSLQFEQAVVRGNVQPKQGQTPYVQWRGWLLLGLSLVMLLLWAYYRHYETGK